MSDPIPPDPIPLSVPSLGELEREMLNRCIDDNFVSSAGPMIASFESDFAKVVAADHAVATASGTAALHLAMRVLGVGRGDLVAVSDFTFIASANVVRYLGADVLLVDSESRSWNMDTGRLHDDVVARAGRGEPIPQVIEVVHVLGHPADVEPLVDLRDRFGVAIVEDAAESLGGTFRGGRHDGQPVGAVGDVAAFSFNGNKIITTGGGGMLVTPRADLAKRARHLSTQAKLAGGHYFHDEVGFNYRMTNLAAALGLAQLERLDEFVAAKRAIAARYGELLDPGLVELAPRAPFGSPTHWLYTIRVDPEQRDGVLLALAESRIGARTVWPPLSDQQPYRHAPRLGGRVGRSIFDSAVSLPSSVDLTAADQRRVCDAVNEALNR